MPLGNAARGQSVSDGSRSYRWGLELRTVDIGSRGERRILRQHLGHVVVGSVDIAVFLERRGGWSASRSGIAAKEWGDRIRW